MKKGFPEYATESLCPSFCPCSTTSTWPWPTARAGRLQGLRVGVDMTRKAFLDILSRHGVTEFGAVGEPFSPETHEALGMTANPGLPDDAVAQVVQKGFTLRGRLLRPAKVMVNKAGAA